MDITNEYLQYLNESPQTLKKQILDIMKKSKAAKGEADKTFFSIGKWLAQDIGEDVCKNGTFIPEKYKDISEVFDPCSSVSEILWPSGSVRDRKKLYNDNKTMYHKHFNLRMKMISKQYPIAKKNWNIVIKASEEIKKLIKDNPEDYKNIPVRFWQILGGVKTKITWYIDDAERAKKLMEIQPSKLPQVLMQFNFLKGGPWDKTLEKIDKYYSEHWWTHYMWHY